MIVVSGGSGFIGSAIRKHLWPALNYDTADPESLGNLNKKYDAFIDCSWPAKPSDQFKTWNTVIDHFKRQQGGKMILFSSIYGHKTPDFGMYAGTEIQAKPIEYAMLKAATEQATRYLAQKLKPYNVQVNCVAPGGVVNKESEKFQQAYFESGSANMIQTKNLLPIIDALLHEDNAINGQIITVDGGWAL